MNYGDEDSICPSNN